MALQPDVYRWNWDYQVRQIFNSLNPVPRRGLTEVQIDAYVRQLDLIEKDIKNKDTTPLLPALLETRISALKTSYGMALPTITVPKPASKADRTTTLNTTYPAGSMPTDAQIKASRTRLGVQPVKQTEKPKGRPQIPEPTKEQNPQRNDNIDLAADPPSIYESIKDANIRNLIRETKDASYNPEQTFKVTIRDPTGGNAAPIDVDVTPIQYAALAGLKGTVRLLLQTKTDTTKKINNKTIIDAVESYRKKDSDKNEVKYIFQIADAAVKDATDDFVSGVQIDSKYGEGLTKEVDKKLAKTLYDREYKDLENPQPLPTTAKKTTSSLTEEAKKKGKEDGAIGSSMNPEYNTKTPQEKEAYGKEYDKARAKQQAEKDALINEPPNLGSIQQELSVYYQAGPTRDATHVTEVEKIYKDTYEANKDKSVDLAKEAGYVGTYPPSSSSLSGNYFGFGPELNKIIGFDVQQDDIGKKSENEYQEGFAKFLTEYNSLVGQAKYAGYMDGMKKNAKYTTPGKIKVGDKQYAVDFGKLNTNLKTQPELGNNNQPVENPDYTEAEDYLTNLKNRVNDNATSLADMTTLVKNTAGIQSVKIKQLLNPIIGSQRGGVQYGGVTKDEVMQEINQIKDTTVKEALLSRLNAADTLSDNEKVDQYADIRLEVIKETSRKILGSPQTKPPTKSTNLQKSTALVFIRKIKENNLELATRLKTEYDQIKEDANKLRSFNTRLNTILNPEATQQAPQDQQSAPVPPPVPQPQPVPVPPPVQQPQPVPVPPPVQQLQGIPLDQQRLQKIGELNIKLERLKGTYDIVDFDNRLNNPNELLNTLETDIDQQITNISGPIQTKIDGLPDGTRKTDFNIRMVDGIFANINEDVDKAIEIQTSIEEIQDQATKTLLKQVFDDMNKSLYDVEKEVKAELVKQEKTIKDKTKRIQKDINKIKDNALKTDFNNRLNVANITINQLDVLVPQVQTELQIQEVEDKINKVIPDGTRKNDFLTQARALGTNLDQLKTDVENWSSLQSKIKRSISYIPDNVPEKAGFLMRIGNTGITLAELETLKDDIAPFVPSWSKIIKQKGIYIFAPIKAAATAIGTSVGTAATTVGTAVTTAATGIRQFLSAASTATAASSVSTKQQLYDKVKQALSTIPKYKQIKVEDIPRGVKPDDPSLDINTNVPKRLQMLYDSEFQRGFREGSRKVGGTKRRDKTSNRVTKKKQGSKK